MITILLAFLCVGATAFAKDEEHLEAFEEDNPNQCSRLLPDDKVMELEKVNFIPDEELLKDVCPHFVSFMKCEEPNVLAGIELNELQYFLDLKQLIIDICEEDSRLQKAYLASKNCFRTELEKVETCIQLAQDIYLDYRKFITREDHDEDDDKEDDYESDAEEEDHNSITPNEPYCITDAYALVCMSIEMLEKCNVQAHDTFLEIVQRSHFLESFCRPEETLRLKSDFLEFLRQDEHPHLNIFQSYFDLKKK